MTRESNSSAMDKRNVQRIDTMTSEWSERLQMVYWTSPQKDQLLANIVQATRSGDLGTYLDSIRAR